MGKRVAGTWRQAAIIAWPVSGSRPRSAMVERIPSELFCPHPIPAADRRSGSLRARGSRRPQFGSEGAAGQAIPKGREVDGSRLCGTIDRFEKIDGESIDRGSEAQ